MRRLGSFGLQGIGMFVSWLIVLLGCVFGACAVPVLLLSLLWLN